MDLVRFYDDECSNLERVSEHGRIRCIYVRPENTLVPAGWDYQTYLAHTYDLAGADADLALFLRRATFVFEPTVTDGLTLVQMRDIEQWSAYAGPRGGKLLFDFDRTLTRMNGFPWIPTRKTPAHMTGLIKYLFGSPERLVAFLHMMDVVTSRGVEVHVLTNNVMCGVTTKLHRLLGVLHSEFRKPNRIHCSFFVSFADKLRQIHADGIV